MYLVYLDKKVIYHPQSKDALILDPKLELADNKAGSFSFKIASTNPFCHDLKPMTAKITVKKDSRILFCGRIISITKDFYGVKQVICEGELAYLLDSIQPAKRYQNYSVRQFIEELIRNHNKQVEPEKRFELGMVTVRDANDSIYRFTNFETTHQAIFEKLVDRLKGHIRIRYEESKRLLDYVEDYENVNKQVISLGNNLLDLTENLDALDITTRIIPLGARVESSRIEGLEEYVSIESVNQGKNYVEANQEVLDAFGKITKMIHFDDVHTPTLLKEKAKKYLQDTQFEKLTLNLSAIDLSLLHQEIEDFKIGDKVRVVSTIHGMDRFFSVGSLSVNLDKPHENTISLGSQLKNSISEKVTKSRQALTEQLKRLPSQSETLRLAKENATALLTAATTGNVITRNNEILIMDYADKTRAQKIWRWNLNGFGYSNHGANGPYETAITMDGSIVADYITTGTLNADLLKAGVIKDKAENIKWNLVTGELVAKKLSIHSKNFTLTSTGDLTAKNVSIQGVVTTESGNNKTIMKAGYLRVFFKNKELGLIGGNGLEGHEEKAGLNFDLESTGDYMTWAVQPPSGGNYNMVWTYAREGLGNFSGGMLNAGCDIDMRNHKIHNVSWPNGAITGTCNFVLINSVESDGTVGSWSNNCYLQFKNGILIGGRF